MGDVSVGSRDLERYEKAWSPVIPRPTIRAWISCVPEEDKVKIEESAI